MTLALRIFLAVVTTLCAMATPEAMDQSSISPEHSEIYAHGFVAKTINLETLDNLITDSIPDFYKDKSRCELCLQISTEMLVHALNSLAGQDCFNRLTGMAIPLPSPNQATLAQQWKWLFSLDGKIMTPDPPPPQSVLQ